MQARLDPNSKSRLLRFVLKPVIAFCVRHALRLQDLIDCAKELFVEVASESLTAQETHIKDSRISVMTGVHRRDVATIRKGPTEDRTYERDLVSKIVGYWQTNPRFLTTDGAPRVLSTGSADSEFGKLCQSVTSDMKPGAILFELERSGTVEVRPKGVALVRGAFVPRGNVEQGFGILSQDMNDLMRAVETNVIVSPALPHLHARTEYDSVRPEGVEELKQWLLREAHKLHLRAREVISSHDQDVNPDPKFSGKKARIVLGSYSYVELSDEVDPE